MGNIARDDVPAGVVAMGARDDAPMDAISLRSAAVFSS